MVTRKNRVVFGGALSLVRLLATRADEIFDSLRGVRALSLLEVVDPIADGVHHIARRFARRLGFCWFAIHALSALHDFYLFL